MLEQNEIEQLVLIGAFLALVPGYVFLASRGAIALVRRFRARDKYRRGGLGVQELLAWTFNLLTIVAVFGSAVWIGRWIEHTGITTDERWLPLLVGAGASSLVTAVLGIVYSVIAALVRQQEKRRPPGSLSAEPEVEDEPTGFVRIADYTEVATHGIQMLIRPLTPPSGGSVQRFLWQVRRWTNENQGLGHWIRAAFAALGAFVTLQRLSGR